MTFSYFFFVLVALLLLFDTSGVAAAGLLAASIHECSHLAVMSALKILPEEIRFNAFGIDIVRNSRPDHGYWKDAAISLAGPAANLLAAGLFSLFCRPIFQVFILANITLFLFNILPVEPLDGGQALYALLCLHWEPAKACRIVGLVSFCFLVPLSVIGFLTLFRSSGNFTLLLICVYLMCLLVFKRGKYF
ncbi:MAG: peptidase M50 [Oscillospiraceae bacterium]|nr:peptidase M50 [Oscillospiraceae bacterium]